jgi:16S rRNA (cytosine967-C5)-methyltransferase
MHRLAGLQSLGCPLVQLSAEKPLPFPARTFDKILVDVPCTGTGTLGRNPEIKWRLIPDDIDNIAITQRSILRQALSALKPGGQLVYSTCSLEPQENRTVIDRVLALLPDFDLISEDQRLPGREEGDGFYSAVIRQKKQI